MWLYHATYKANINSIKKWGLGAIQNKNWNISIKNNICLSPNPEEANSFCECAEDVLEDVYNSGIVVLAINTTNLKKELLKGYKNVVFICLDGMGINPIKINLDKGDLLRKNIKQVLTSTFPSTTTNATTALACNKLPLEHGWLGWSIHFDESDQNLDIYLHSNSQTGDKVEYEYPLYDNSDCYFNHANTDYEINSILPIYVKTKNTENRITISNEKELCSAVKEICAKDGRQFVYAYLPEPDSTMHEFGVSSQEAKEKLKRINEEIDCEMFILSSCLYKEQAEEKISNFLKENL